jgi:hypothetical protein
MVDSEPEEGEMLAVETELIKFNNVPTLPEKRCDPPIS